MITDCHTHSFSPHAITSLEPDEAQAAIAAHPGQLFSIGIHPWSLKDVPDQEVERRMRLLTALASHPQVVAIGETGLDSACGAPMQLQRDLLLRHMQLSEAVRKPLVLHVVRTAHEILALRKKYGKELHSPWIWHGFRGNAVLVSQFCAFPGTYISLGSHFNAAAAAAIPEERLLLETDTSPEPVEAIAERVAEARRTTPGRVAERVCDTARKLFGEHPGTTATN